jgi:hypothetical protein
MYLDIHIYLCMYSGFHTLDMTAVTKAYRGAKHRLILLDWGGTLVAESDKVYIHI